MALHPVCFCQAESFGEDIFQFRRGLLSGQRGWSTWPLTESRLADASGDAILSSQARELLWLQVRSCGGSFWFADLGL